MKKRSENGYWKMKREMDAAGFVGAVIHGVRDARDGIGGIREEDEGVRAFVP